MPLDLTPCFVFPERYLGLQTESTISEYSRRRRRVLSEDDIVTVTSQPQSSGDKPASIIAEDITNANGMLSG